MTAVDAFKSAFSSAPIGMAFVDLSGRFLDINDAFCRITGHTRDQLRLRTLPSLVYPDDVAVDDVQRQALFDGHLQSYQTEKRILHAWGHALWTLLTVSIVRDEAGHPTYLIWQIQDISERKKLEGRVANLLDHDFLTGLYNRRYFEHTLSEAVAAAARYGGEGAILVLDLDNFKEINDRFGHAAGDELLRTVAAALKAQVRRTDVLARLGGDEFGIILPHATGAQARVAAEEILNVLRRQSATLGADVIRITASVGAATYDHLTSTEVMAAADLAMYEVKQAGRDGFSLYRPITEGARSGNASQLLEAEGIRRAILDGRLELHCQPILDLRTNVVSSYELLVRLRTEQGELLMPNAFLYIAERLGTIVAIDSWVVEQAVALIADQDQARRALTLNVNISGKSVGSADLVSLVGRVLDAASVDPARIVFELTETATISHLEQAKAFISSMRGRGCQLALDDFGTGFGSFFYLKEIPFDYLKIDGGFVRGFTANLADQLVVEAIVGIAKGMGRQTVAEFVADRDMTERLRESGVDYAQGYYIGAPRPVADVFA